MHNRCDKAALTTRSGWHGVVTSNNRQRRLSSYKAFPHQSGREALKFRTMSTFVSLEYYRILYEQPLHWRYLEPGPKAGAQPKSTPPSLAQLPLAHRLASNNHPPNAAMRNSLTARKCIQKLPRKTPLKAHTQIISSQQRFFRVYTC